MSEDVQLTRGAFVNEIILGKAHFSIITEKVPKHINLLFTAGALMIIQVLITPTKSSQIEYF